MMKPDKSLSRTAVRYTILLMILAWSPAAAGRCQTQHEEEVKADSAIVLHQYGDWSFTATLACTQGVVTAVVKMEDPPSKIVRRFPGVTLEPYLKLWQELEEIGIWELPSGEFWRHRELIEAQGYRTGIRLSEVDPSDYREHLAPDDLVEVRVRVKNREHGFLRYHPENLKDRRYSRVHEAIWRAAGLDNVLKELITKTTER